MAQLYKELQGFNEEQINAVFAETIIPIIPKEAKISMIMAIAKAVEKITGGAL